ncbi:MAG: hypothetical protein P8178_02875 [Candidatus Thiodiazotropha sp.]
MTSSNEQPAQGEDEIPILEDIVTTDELERDSEFIEFAEPAPAASSVPEYDEVLLAMRDDIAVQLEQDLLGVAAEAVERAIAESTERIAQVLHDELDGNLAHRIRGLIAQRMEQEFGPREQHQKGAPADANGDSDDELG